MASRILTPDQIDRMADMRERGMTYSQIARILTAQGAPVSMKTIQWWCLRVGAIAPPSAYRGTAGMVRTYQRDGQDVLPFTPEEDARLLHLEATGKGHTEIARQMSRPRSSVIARLMRLARQEAMQEAA
jgi:hypothetical protein